MSYVKIAAKLQKMFYIHNNFSEKMFYTRNIFYKKSVCHAQHISIKLHKIAHLSVILNISKDISICNASPLRLTFLYWILL